MAESRLCGICGTVNVLTGLRCIACGTPFDPEKTPTPKQPGTVSLHPGQVQALLSESQKLPEPVDGPGLSAWSQAETDSSEPPATLRYLLRLLVAETGPSNVEVGEKPVPLGSGPLDVGETGDPLVRECEGRLFMSDGDLYMEPSPDSDGLYLRLRDEVRLEDGDVILIGYVAMRFDRVQPAAPIDPTRQVVGGSAGTACGRLTFLRRDGTLGPIHDLPSGHTILGRTGGHLNFPDDARLSRRHASIVASDKGVRLEDLGSRNGTFLRVRRTTRLEAGDSLRVGAAGLIVRGPLEQHPPA